MGALHLSTQQWKACGDHFLGGRVQEDTQLPTQHSGIRKRTSLMKGASEMVCCGLGLDMDKAAGADSVFDLLR